MTKMPYQWVQPKVWQLCESIMDDSNPFAIMDAISDWIEFCGWTPQEFDDETLKRIDMWW